MDIVFGALCSSLFFTRLVNQKPPLIYWILLAGSVWLIYLIDHVFDSHFIQNENSSPRSIFFRKNRKFIISLIAILFASILSLLLFTPFTLLLIGIPGAVLITVYLFLNQKSIKKRRLYFLRELVIAILYLYGVSAYPIFLTGNFNTHLYFYLLAFLFLILGNVLIYSFFGAREDKADGVQTLIFLMTPAKIRILNLILLGLAMGLFLILLLSQTNYDLHAIIGVSMAIGLFTIQFFRSFFSVHGRYGLIADAVFLSPFILLFVTN